MARGPYRVPGLAVMMPWSIGTPATTVIPSRTASSSPYGAWKKVGIPAYPG